MDLRPPLCETLGIERPLFLAGMRGVAYASAARMDRTRLGGLL